MNATTLAQMRGVIVAVVGLGVLLLVAVVGILALPDAIPKDAADAEKGERIVGIVTPLITAVAAIIAAYFGVRSANAAREGAEEARQRDGEIARRVVAHLPPEEATRVMAEAEEAVRGRIGDARS